MAGQIKAGRSAVITPDGPRGPARQMSMGPVSLAQLTGAQITLVAWSAQRCWRAKSWDKMRFPKPFSPIICSWSDPIDLPRTKSKAELEQQRVMIESRLNELVKTIDQQTNQGQATDQQPDSYNRLWASVCGLFCRCILAGAACAARKTAPSADKGWRKTGNSNGRKEC